MGAFSVYLFWAGVVSAGVASAAYLLYVFGSRVVVSQAATNVGTVSVTTTSQMPRSMAQAGTFATWLCIAFLTLSLGARTIATGHPQYTNMYEFTVAFGWGISVFYALFERRYRQRTLGAVMMPV